MKSQEKTIEGNLKITSKGSGFVSLDPVKNPDGSITPPNPDDSIFIWSENLNTGIHLDRVRIEMLPPNPRFPGRKEGKILAILTRTKPEWVGTVQMANKNRFVLPGDARMYRDIFVAPENANNATTGDKVAVKITHWSDPTRNP
ncbi:MAG: hypothetical protein V4674_00600, partial [Patescibacteria group bacterium]